MSAEVDRETYFALQYVLLQQNNVKNCHLNKYLCGFSFLRDHDCATYKYYQWRMRKMRGGKPAKDANDADSEGDDSHSGTVIQPYTGVGAEHFGYTELTINTELLPPLHISLYLHVMH